MGIPSRLAVEKIKSLRADGWSLAEIAALFGLEESEVDRISRTGRDIELPG